jgi:caffeoyl-CoA O-methyltransferase
MRTLTPVVPLACLVLLGTASNTASGQTTDLDSRVRAFLAEHEYSWRDMNVPAADGQYLYDLIIEHGFTRALEVGTSTGHSGIWIAWALSKTGGRLITIEIDEQRHREAVANFEAAGLSAFIDARLANAHDLVPALDGPFDFVFQDADKDWYTRYFELIYPKLAPAACYVAHNVSQRGGRGMHGFIAALDTKPDLTTEFVAGRRSGGMSVSCRAGSQ